MSCFACVCVNSIYFIVSNKPHTYNLTHTYTNIHISTVSLYKHSHLISQHTYICWCFDNIYICWSRPVILTSVYIYCCKLHTYLHLYTPAVTSTYIYLHTNSYTTRTYTYTHLYTYCICTRTYLHILTHTHTNLHLVTSISTQHPNW